MDDYFLSFSVLSDLFATYLINLFSPQSPHFYYLLLSSSCQSLGLAPIFIIQLSQLQPLAFLLLLQDFEALK